MKKSTVLTISLVLGSLAAINAFSIIEARRSAERRRHESNEVLAQARVALPTLCIWSLSCQKSYGFFIVEGEVQNTSSHPIHDLFAIGLTYDSRGDFVSSDDALVDYDPLLPGQKSPFKVMIRENPEIKTCGLSFKLVDGRQLAYADSSRRRRRR